MLKPRVFKITGMDCVEEVTLLKREVGPLVGGEDKLAFNVFRGEMTVHDLPDSVPTESVIDAVKRAGLDGALVGSHYATDETATSAWRRNERLILTAASGILILVALAIQPVAPSLAKVSFTLASLAGVWLVLPKALNAVKRFQPDMNLLMTIAVVGAMAIGEWFEAATVAFLFSLSLLLESWSVGRARRAVAALMDLSPPTVRLVKDDGGTEEVSPQHVNVGNRFLVKPGERIALDGEVIEGTSDVNQAPITGESMPVTKSAGVAVFAGTINGDGALTIASTKRAEDTTLAKIVRMVAEAQSRRGPSEQWVESFARIYTPAVMVLALLLFLIPPLFFAGDWSEWLYRSLVLLVIACPCALVISTPVSVVAGLTAASRQGVLVKGGVYLEAPARLKAIAFDKTGTLTLGRPQVVEVVPLSGHDERELIERLAALEAHSEHPIAHAVLEYAKKRGIVASAASDFQVIKGKGARATIDGRDFWLGSHRYVEERGQESPELHERLERLAEGGRTVVVVGNDQHVCGMIALADEVRAGTRTTLEQLRELGVQHLIMLTGDNRPTAKSIADAVGVDEVLAELLPEDKVTAVDTLVAKYGNVAMIGDGVNDAPALARASIGIAMGSAGTDAAIETADIALMADDLSRLPWLIEHSRKTLRVIRQNVIFSLGVKALFFVLTLVGLSSLWGAIAADTGASLLVVFNGLRLLQVRQLSTNVAAAQPASPQRDDKFRRLPR